MDDSRVDSVADANSDSIVITPGASEQTAQAASGMSDRPSARPGPTVLTMQDLLDLPRQILPEQTYQHLQNAAREAMLAAYSLWRSLNNSRKLPRARKHIDVD